MDSLSADRRMCIEPNMALTALAKKGKVTINSCSEKLLFFGDKDLWRSNWHWRLFQAKGVVGLSQLKEAVLAQGYQHAALEHVLTACQAFQPGYLPKIIGLGYESNPYIITETNGKRVLQQYPYHLVMSDNIFVLGVKPMRGPRIVK